MRGRGSSVAAVLLAGAVACAAAEPAAQSRSPAPEKIASRNLPNCYRIAPGVYSGGQPSGEAAFRDLHELGVRTVVSVDGAQPDVEAAHRAGLRYVHLPHGYDAVPAERVRQVAAALRDLPGPVYVHCHHGKHRGPSAAAAACVALGKLDRQGALAALKAAGTDPAYRGLYQSVESTRPLAAAELDGIAGELPESADVAPLTSAMVDIDAVNDRLKEAATVAWKPTAELDPAQAATRLEEQFGELQADPAMAGRPQALVEHLRASRAGAGELRAALAAEPPDAPRVDAAWLRVTANCKACHQQFRDVQQGAGIDKR